MAEEIRSKAELLALFADNTNGAISAQDVRDFVVSNQVSQVQNISTVDADIDVLADIAFMDAGAIDPLLPLAADYKARTITIGNASGAAVDVYTTSPDVINGSNFITVPDGKFAILAPGAVKWFVVVESAEEFTGVVSDATLEGDGITGTPLKVADGIIQDVMDNSAKNSYPAIDALKLAGIEVAAEVNNISDADALQLTGGAETILHSHPAPTVNVYGTERHQVEDLTETSTTNKFSTPNATNEKLVMTTAALPAGTYRISAHFQFVMEKDGKFMASIYDGISYLLEPMKYKSDENSDMLTAAFVSGDMALSGVNTFKLIFGPEASGWDTDCIDAVMELIRVS